VDDPGVLVALKALLWPALRQGYHEKMMDLIGKTISPISIASLDQDPQAVS
jgi:hypothetical protein